MTYWQRSSGRWQVRLVGEVTMSGTDGTWEAPDVGSRKARTLLALLGVAHGRMVAVETVVDELWGDNPPRQPRANVATLVSRLRARFGPDVIIGGRLGYRLGDTVRVDLHDAAQDITFAESTRATGRLGAGLAAAERGLELLGDGTALADYPLPEWAERARAMQAGLLRRGRHAGAECALRAGQPATAEAWAQAAILTDPLDERAYGMLMRAHDAMGEPSRALIAYERLRTTLATELGTGPVAAIRNLHVAILRGNAVSA